MPLGFVICVLVLFDWHAVYLQATPVSAPCDAAMREANEHMRVAVCFWGLNRSLKATLKSIRQMIFGALEAACIPYDVYWSTYNRSAQDPLVIDGIQLLQPKRFTVDDQDVFMRQEGQHVVDGMEPQRWWLGYPDAQVVQKFVLELNLLRQVTQLWVQSGTKYRAVLYVRPDMCYVHPLKTEALLSAKQKHFYVPCWHAHGGYNDRMGFGAPAAAEAYGNRLAMLPEFVRHLVSMDQEGVNSEQFLFWVLNRRLAYTVRYIMEYAVIVRNVSLTSPSHSSRDEYRMEGYRALLPKDFKSICGNLDIVRPRPKSRPKGGAPAAQEGRTSGPDHLQSTSRPPLV